MDCFLKNTQASNGSRIVPYETTDEQTDITNLIVAFHYFANAPKNEAFDFPDGTTFCYWILSDYNKRDCGQNMQYSDK
jgi:hypothetical protein